MRKLNEIDQDIKDKMVEIERLERKFNDNPCKETATPLSNAKNQELPQLRAEYREAYHFYNFKTIPKC